MLLRDRRINVLLFLVLTVFGIGCQLVPDKLKNGKDLFTGKENDELPSRMMVIWTDTVLHQPQQPGIRGFGGRIYFYAEDDSEPIEVDGGLAVYAFDADSIDPESVKPERKFVFTAEQFAEHMSQTSMGSSYSVWIPWDEVGGYSKKLSLIVRFEGTGGGVVISDPTIKLLPGLDRPEIQTPSLARSNVSQANNVQQDAGIDPSSTRLAGFEEAQPKNKVGRRQTETIDLPPSFYRHLHVTNQPVETQDVDTTPSGAESGSAPVNALNGASQSNDDSDRQDDAPENESAQQTMPRSTKWARYPFRTLGEGRPTIEGLNRNQTLQAGWMEPLPRTPRYSYPNGVDLSVDHE
ncbi:hypothetical protein Q31b_11810 [Novipirellula aureliae]|uniref:Uncharacterized protein n=1 Tax=Novipirellula aureliae TaxID=2527966 RepID=A0A5C6E8J9_9BACT|nr:hypothetical protein [Novipirellula aureliae]TWU46003.1 hypothetical protein Q31b_11810 [Novipirellula aureliae]